MEETKLSKRELQHYEALLKQKRETLYRLSEELEKEGLQNLDDQGVIPHITNHPGELSSNMQNQEFDLELASRIAKQLEVIEGALQRLETNSYGYCTNCGDDIPKKRLEAMPEAPLCIECQEDFEMAERPAHAQEMPFQQWGWRPFFQKEIPDDKEPIPSDTDEF
jgi:DnaK suppressor protein